MNQAESKDKTFCHAQKGRCVCPQNVWTEDENVNMMQLEDKEFNLCDFALFMSVMKSELLEEKGSVSENTQKMLLQETDKERLKLWLKKAARSDSEADFLKKIQEE